MTELSIVIVSYNVCSYLRESIRSVITASQNIDCEIVVVDNHSSDDSVSMVEGEFDNIRLIVSENNEGFASACNKGIVASSGEFVLILNPDTVVSHDSLEEAMTFMRQHPEAGAIGARMTDGNGVFLPESKRGFPSPFTSFFRFSGIWKFFSKSPVFNRYYLGNFPDHLTCRADILTGAFMFIRREALNRAGLFDTSFFMYGEDIDLSWRIIRAGYINYYVPSVRITHFKGKSASSDDPARVRHFYEAMIIFTRKHLRFYWHLPVVTMIYLMLEFRLLVTWFRRRFKKKTPVVKNG